MKKLLIAVGALLMAAATHASDRYILRYTESEPLGTFLARYGLVREISVPNRPIHAVRDPLRRHPATLLALIASQTDGDVGMELDQTVRLPIFTFRTNQAGGLSGLLTATTRTQPTGYFGASVPLGVLDQWPVRQVRADSSWYPHGGGLGLVAVVDTGVDGTHPFFAGRVVAGVDFLTAGGTGSELTGLSDAVRATVNPTTTPLLRRLTYLSGGHAPLFEDAVRNSPNFAAIPKGLGHGTMVAGAIRLVAPNAQILPIRAFHQDGSGRLFNVIRAIHVAQARGAQVVNLSLNTAVYSPELERTAQEVSDRGVILVASTGNNGLTNVGSYPAGCDKVTGVASVDAAGRRSLFSNAGTDLTWVAAPGEGLLLPFPGNRWAGGWGTSFSAPLVSGLAAKLRSRKADLTYSDLQSAIGKSAPLPDQNLGLGLLDVFNSVAGF